MAFQRRPVSDQTTTSLLLLFVLVSFAANSLITRHIVARNLLDAGLLSAVRFIAGTVALFGLSVALRDRIVVGRANLVPALWLGVYAICISYGYLTSGLLRGLRLCHGCSTLSVGMFFTGARSRHRAIGAGICSCGDRGPGQWLGPAP